MTLPLNTLEYAKSQDQADPLQALRSEFHFPKLGSDGKDSLYFTGNSLGLQPRKAEAYIREELEDWARLGVEGHLHARHPWLPYHEFVTEPAARVVGALPSEVVTMNTLTVNLHLMMVSFYRPTSARYKILIEGSAFPSDQYAVASQAKMHGYDPKTAVIELLPRAGEATLRTEDIVATIQKNASELALVMLGGVNYLSGQAFDMAAITRSAHQAGAVCGFDLAHAAGNLHLKLHDWNVDFAVWCNYKYLNSGPGAIAGAFVHEKHARTDRPRFAGWWGHDKATRFKMGPDFSAIPGAEGWQLSNPPIFQLAALRASLELFDRATMPALRAKSVRLTAYLESLLRELPEGFCTIITPGNPQERGCQLSLRFKPKKGSPKDLQDTLVKAGAICDFREPDIIRAAPTPLYNSFEDVYRLCKVLEDYANA